nr:MAG TPA_asm: hypothetical protein [Caudoviricetes sp.]
MVRKLQSRKGKRLKNLTLLVVEMIIELFAQNVIVLSVTNLIM